MTGGRPFGNVDYPADKLYNSEFSRETEPIGYVNIYIERLIIKELTHVIMEGGKSKSAVWAGRLET